MRCNLTTHTLKWIIGIYSILIMTGCSTTMGRNFNSSKVQKIELDHTTEMKIREWFGTPESDSTKGLSSFETKVLFYGYVKRNNNIKRFRTLTVEIRNGVVYSYLFSSSLPEDATEFDIKLRSRLLIGQTTMSDAKNILGTPGGRIQFPTNMLSDELLNVAPEGTEEIWYYLYFDLRKNGDRVKIYKKALFLFFDGDGELVHTYVDYVEP